jgi:hypothetical protein
VLVDEANELQVVVKSVKDNTFNSNRTGAQTVINSDQIKSLPSLSRNIADFARLTPQAQISGDDVLSMVVKIIDIMRSILMELLITMFWIIFKRY